MPQIPPIRRRFCGRGRWPAFGGIGAFSSKPRGRSAITVPPKHIALESIGSDSIGTEALGVNSDEWAGDEKYLSEAGFGRLGQRGPRLRGRAPRKRWPADDASTAFRSYPDP